jgi:hypothetical protein
MRRLLLISVILFTGCKALDRSLENAARNITINTAEPIKVNMTIDVNVYQHDAKDGKKPEEDTAKNDLAELKRRKFNRQKEIQDLKNSRFVAETHRGTLFLREVPAGDYGNYVRKAVEDENTDRIELMRQEAADSRRELNQIMQERYEANIKNSHPGEWIELPDSEKPGSWRLMQKVGGQ